MVTPSGILTWEIPWTEEPGGLPSMSCKEWDTTEHMSITRLLSSANPSCELQDQEVGLNTSWNYNRHLWITLSVSFFEVSGLSSIQVSLNAFFKRYKAMKEGLSLLCKVASLLTFPRVWLPCVGNSACCFAREDFKLAYLLLRFRKVSVETQILMGACTLSYCHPFILQPKLISPLMELESHLDRI